MASRGHTDGLRFINATVLSLTRSASKLILIDHAGHFALVTPREEFLMALIKYVSPLAKRLQ